MFVLIYNYICVFINCECLCVYFCGVLKCTVNLFSERLASTNLIDLNCDIVAPPPRPHDYVNDIVVNNSRSPRDVFDMRMYYCNIKIFLCL